MNRACMAASAVLLSAAALFATYRGIRFSAERTMPEERAMAAWGGAPDPPGSRRCWKTGIQCPGHACRPKDQIVEFCEECESHSYSACIHDPQFPVAWFCLHQYGVNGNQQYCGDYWEGMVVDLDCSCDLWLTSKSCGIEMPISVTDPYQSCPGN
jgi:hypothetical protein